MFTSQGCRSPSGLAARAQAYKLHPVAKDFIVGTPSQPVIERFHRFYWSILHGTALRAAQVIVGRCLGVIAPLRACQLDLLHFSLLGEDLEVAVNGSQTDPWQTPSDLSVQLISRWMRSELSELIEDNAALLGHPESFRD